MKIFAGIARALLSGALLLAAPLISVAHDVPADVVVRGFLKADEQRLNLLLRVPLEAMRDVVLPTYGPGYLDLARADEALHDAAVIWIGNAVELYENDRRLAPGTIVAARASLPSDRSFGSYETALAHLAGPRLPDDAELLWKQALLDVQISYEIVSPAAAFAIKPNLNRLGLRTTTVLRYIDSEGDQWPFEFSGDPGLVRLNPGWQYAFLHFLKAGFSHILDGADHLLFILSLIIPFRRLRPLLVIVTAFTVAHSITLISSAFGLLPAVAWFSPLIETLIAASIVYMALENIVGSRWQRRWLIAFGFGLVHGFGFSFALSQTLQFAGTHLVTALLAFNLGIELGQIFVILLALPVLNWLFRHVLAERPGIVILSALLAHSGWHWMTERLAVLRAFSFSWPAPDLALLASLLRWAMLLLLIALAVRAMQRLYRRWLAADEA
ncbi:MAG: hypothetical protein BMS9Abin32_584 [Gammaproteobacteria bacterium]|nr:MAG: hypothetical protein BMS9Abin32_584 [Gammaproteobacteria bacterium]